MLQRSTGNTNHGRSTGLDHRKRLHGQGCWLQRLRMSTDSVLERFITQVALSSLTICEPLLKAHRHLRCQFQVRLARKLAGLQEVVQPPALHAVGFEGRVVGVVEP